MRERAGELAILVLVLTILAVGCTSSNPPPQNIISGSPGSCINTGNGTAGSGASGDGGTGPTGSPGGVGINCQPTGSPVLSPVPVVVVERRTEGGGASSLTAGSVASIIAEFEAKR